MTTWEAAAGLLGGVGLFLLGMGLMTDGLRLAAGPQLERVLARSTATRWRGLAAGTLMTALVQSSSAVTVAAIGFVNAGLLTLGQSMWVLFGANVGTTMTGWLVALVGMQFAIDAFALPLVGVGMALRLISPGGRRGAFGLALAGFGVLFLGIDLLKEAFSGAAAGFTLPRIPGIAGVAAMLLAGTLMTVAMQSSSASTVLVFTAAQSGMIGLDAAAAAVIGANIGTTVTALLAAIGATPNARRAAAAHVLFNVLTGGVALLLLPWLLDLLVWLRALLEQDAMPAATLALFHTVFNVLGVILMWPLADALARFLAQRFRTAEEDEARPRHLDANVAAVPVLALGALEQEVRRIGAIALRMMQDALARPEGARAFIERDHAVVARLNRAVAEFIARLERAEMSQESVSRLPRLMRVARYYATAAELAREAATSGDGPAAPLDAGFLARAEALLAAPEGATDDFEAAYQTLKAALLEAGADGRLTPAAMDARLRRASALRRGVNQMAKAARMLAAQPSGLEATEHPEEESEPPLRADGG
ncbi:MAG: Na/Pi symporter [Pseudomonadota bacterium]